uniref:Uncharacterized protein n=1 Tax=Desulfatirhabdium butyrativorans TaxID=340467 RepID=A0A7C4RUN6_9BACT
MFRSIKEVIPCSPDFCLLPPVSCLLTSDSCLLTPDFCSLPMADATFPAGIFRSSLPAVRFP